MHKQGVALFISIFLVFIIYSQAARFSTNGGYGNSTVGGLGADYSTLYDAATDFNSYTLGCQGNWTLWINSNLIEINACPFGNTVGTNTVTLRPTSGGTKTIKFTNYNSPGINGHFIIGSVQTTNKDVLKKTDNFIINGSPDNSDVQNLVLCNAGSIASTRTINVYGDCDNIAIKNCYVINTSTHTSSISAICFTSRKTTNAINAATPDFGIIDHCIVTGPSTNKDGLGIEFSSSPLSFPSGQAQTGMSVTRCLINARDVGIFLNINAGGTIASNTIRLNQPNPNYLSKGIYYSSSNGAAGWTMNINGNVFDKMTTGNTSAGGFGLVAIDASGVPVGGTATFNITNNMISAEQWGFTGTANPISYWAIRGSSNTATYNIYHNSICLPNKSTLSGMSSAFCNAIAITGNSFGGTANIKNNIIYMGQSGGAAIYKNGSGTFNCDYNVIYICSTATAGRVGTTLYSTFADWTSAGYDIHGQSIDPSATSPGKWISLTDLHFNNTATPLYPVPGIPTLTTDIDGDSRNVNCWPGADELFGVTVPIKMSFFECQ